MVDKILEFGDNNLNERERCPSNDTGYSAKNLCKMNINIGCVI